MLARLADIRVPAVFGAREVVRKPKKPPEILYGVDDAPPAPVVLLSACQHVGNLAISVVTPVAIFHLAKVPGEVTASAIGIGFLVMALAAILQALPRGPVGSGYLAPSSFAGLFITPAVAALTVGGFPLMCG